MRTTLLAMIVVFTGLPALAAPPDLEFPKFTPPRIVPQATPHLIVDSPIRVIPPTADAYATQPAVPPAPARFCEDCPLARVIESHALPATAAPVCEECPLARVIKSRRLPAPASPPSGGRLTTASIPVEHGDAAHIVARLQQAFKNAKPSPLLVPDPGRRAIHVIATPSQLKAIRGSIAELTSQTRAYVLAIRVRQLDGGKPGKTIAAPVIAVTRDRVARFQVAGPGDSQIEITAIVTKKDAKPPRLIKTTAMRAHGIPWPVKRLAGVVLTSGTAPAKDARRHVRAYAVGDLLDGDGPKLSPEALLAAIRLTAPANGGTTNSAEFVRKIGVIVVRHTQAGHQKVVTLLQALRTARKE